MEEVKKSVSDDFFRYSAFLDPAGWREMFQRLLDRIDRSQAMSDKRKIKYEGVDWI